MKAYLLRLSPLCNDKQTVGNFILINDDNEAVFSCYTLELPWLNNAKSISCIPAGKYFVDKQYSGHFGVDTFTVNKVKDRTYIRIHPGNFTSDIQGCILLGESIKDINNDGIIDVINSKDTIDALKSVTDSFDLLITYL